MLQADLGRPALEAARDGEAGVGEDAAASAAFPDMTSATKTEIPRCGRRLGELLEQPRPHALALQRVGDGERDLGGRGVAQPDVVRERDDLVVQGARPARRGRPSRDRGTARPSRAGGSGSRGSAGRRSARTGRRGTRARRPPSAATGGRSRSVPPWRRMTSRNSEVADHRDSVERRGARLHRSTRGPPAAKSDRPVSYARAAVKRAFEIGGYAAAVVLLAFGIASLVISLNGRSEVRTNVEREASSARPT